MLWLEQGRIIRLDGEPYEVLEPIRGTTPKSLEAEGSDGGNPTTLGPDGT